MAREVSVREVAAQLGLTHLEVNRRIHKKQIKARKVGWFWVIEQSEVDRVKEAEWYKKVMQRRAASA
jgi:excisionase family DNA binding protein